MNDPKLNEVYPFTKRSIKTKRKLQLVKLFSQKLWYPEIWSLVRNYKNYFFNPFVPNAPLLYPLKTLENRKVF